MFYDSQFGAKGATENIIRRSVNSLNVTLSWIESEGRQSPRMRQMTNLRTVSDFHPDRIYILKWKVEKAFLFFGRNIFLAIQKLFLTLVRLQNGKYSNGISVNGYDCFSLKCLSAWKWKENCSETWKIEKSSEKIFVFSIFSFVLITGGSRLNCKLSLTRNNKCPLGNGNNANNVKKKTNWVEKVFPDGRKQAKRKKVKVLTKVVKISIFALALSGVLFHLCERESSRSDNAERIKSFIHQGENFRWVMNFSRW